MAGAPPDERARRSINAVTEACCRLCGEGVSQGFPVREMMFGTREAFTYVECLACGCLQIAEIPTDLKKYYPDRYYSFSQRTASPSRRLRTRAIGSLIAATRLWPPARESLGRRYRRFRLLSLYDDAAGRDRAASILDVGAGAGEVVEELVAIGYRAAEGIDAYIAADRVHGDRVLVRRTELANLAGRYRVVSFNHSLEHMPDQVAALSRARASLAPGGCLILRLPVTGGLAGVEYREHWAGFDAPRHLYIHSRKSLDLAARQAGLRIARIVHDGAGHDFWLSELYRRGIPLHDPEKSTPDAATTWFSSRQIAAFERRARRANAAERGDAVAAVLVPAEHA
jgi:SAM-dependent methyltransferase